jgi:hypothetical protein
MDLDLLEWDSGVGGHSNCAGSGHEAGVGAVERERGVGVRKAKRRTKATLGA